LKDAEKDRKRERKRKNKEDECNNRMKALDQQSLGLAKNRPRRNIKKPTFFGLGGYKGEAGESQYCLVDCVKYKDEDQQKWKVYVTTSALLMMQLHCHLLKNEVIGFVAGH
jgi:hypothetical protein